MLKIKDKKLYMVSFIVPIAIVLAAYLANGIMTDYSILINDLSGQYSSFLLYYRDHLAENGLFYSFSKGLGGNFFGIFTYYLTSPLNLIVFLFPSAKIEIAVAVIILLRFGLSSVTFSWFIQRTTDGDNRCIAVIMGVVYSLSSYMVIMSYHLLWGDVYFMLPVIMAFLLDIFKGKSPRNFIIAFSLMIISNYYMAYMVGIFCAIMFVHNCISSGDMAKQFKMFFTLAKAAVISIGLTAWLLIPTIFALLQGKFTIPDDRVTAFGIGDIIAKLFIGSYDNVGNLSAPYIYCGAAAVVLFCGILFLKNKNVKEKIADLFVAAVLLLSMWFVPLNKVWHMFAAPNAFPYRFTFVFAFFILWKGAEFVSAEVTKGERRWFASFAGALLAVICFVAVKQGAVSTVKIAVTSAIALTVIILYLVYRITDNKFLLFAMALVMAGDMALNACSLIGANYDMLEKYPAGIFEENYNTIQQQLDSVEKDGFYRVFCLKNHIENVVDYTENTGFRHGFNEMYRAFTSLTENEFESLRGNTLSPTDKKIVRVAMGAEYYINEHTVKEVKETVFPVMYKTPDRPQQTDDLVAYIEDVTGIKVVTAEGKPDMEALDAAGKTAQSNGAENFVQKRNKITAVVNSDTDNQFVATSIVWDDGWTIKVNGEKKTVHRVLNNLMGFYVHTGENIIEMTYTPKGFYAGVAVTGAAILLCALWVIIKKKKIK